MDPSSPPSTSLPTQPTPDFYPSQQPRLVLVRHGKPDVNENLHPSLWPLSGSGRDAIISLANKLRVFKFGGISSSPELKALGTAEVLAQKLGLDLEIDKELGEHARQPTSFLPQAEFEEGLAQMFASPKKLVFGKETADEALERFSRALERVCGNAEGNDVLVVTHGTVSSIYVSRRLGIDALSLWRSLTTPMAIVISGKEMEIIRA